MYVIIFFLSSLLLVGCQPNCYQFEPAITYCPPAKLIQRLPSPFPKLTKEELASDWGKELYIGLHFGHDMDLYRAITAFKRALIFIPPRDRRLQIEYQIVQCYYLGAKYNEAIEAFDQSGLLNVPASFPVCQDLAVILYDCYFQTDQEEKGSRVLEMLKKMSPTKGTNVELGEALQTGDFETIQTLAPKTPANASIQAFLDEYCCLSKSPQKARLLNAFLPGAGYAYVGQKQAAFTSFAINVLFTGAAYYFFRHENIPMGIILASLESGWYIGGMNGAALAAKEYNERLYESKGKEMMLCEKLFPVLMLETSF